MLAFIVECPNRPGEIARVCGAIGDRWINITTFGSVAWGDAGGVGFCTSDPDGTRQVLDGSGYRYREVEGLEFSLPDRAGTLGDACRKLADAGVNIEFLAPSAIGGGDVTFFCACDNVPAAKQALGEKVLAHA
jgi:hypothetical protein